MLQLLNRRKNNDKTVKEVENKTIRRKTVNNAVTLQTEETKLKMHRKIVIPKCLSLSVWYVGKNKGKEEVNYTSFLLSARVLSSAYSYCQRIKYDHVSPLALSQMKRADVSFRFPNSKVLHTHTHSS